MPQLDLGSVLGPQGPKGDPGNQGTVGPRGPQGERGDAGKDATINGVNALQISVGQGLKESQEGGTYSIAMGEEDYKNLQNAKGAVRFDQAQTLTPAQQEQAQHNIGTTWPCNPNLLDNWYFGNPVDQRGWYVVPPGVAYAGGSSGTTTKYYTVKATYMYNNVKYAVFDVDGAECNVPFYACVRGYMGAGYTVDRWKINGGGLRVTSTGLQFDTSYVLFQNLDLPISLPNTIATVSYLLADGNVYSGLLTTGYIAVGPYSVTNDNSNILYINKATANAPNILAAKLELGPTQTLAHQENGQWVLNEVPDYGGQLRRCQWYAEKTVWNVCLAVATTTTTIEFCGSYYFKVQKRVPPVITVLTPAQAATIYDTVANVYYTDVEVLQPTAYNAAMMSPKIQDSKGRFVVGRIYQVIIGDGQYLVSADL